MVIICRLWDGVYEARTTGGVSLTITRNGRSWIVGREQFRSFAVAKLAARVHLGEVLTDAEHAKLTGKAVTA